MRHGKRPTAGPFFRAVLLLGGRFYESTLMLLKTFRSRPIKRMRRTSGGILLTLLSAKGGHQGGQLLVTQDEWNEHGSSVYLPGLSLPKLREQIAQIQSPLPKP